MGLPPPKKGEVIRLLKPFCPQMEVTTPEIILLSIYDFLVLPSTAFPFLQPSGTPLYLVDACVCISRWQNCL